MRQIDTSQAIFSRMCEATHSRNAAEFAEKMGKTRQAVYQALRKGVVPSGWTVEVACLTGCSVDWLLFGQENAGVPSDKVLVDRMLFEKLSVILEEIEKSEL